MLKGMKEGMRNASWKVPISYWKKKFSLQIVEQWTMSHKEIVKFLSLKMFKTYLRQSFEQSDITLKLSWLEKRVGLADLQIICNKILSFYEILAVPFMRIL